MGAGNPHEVPAHSADAEVKLRDQGSGRLFPPDAESLQAHIGSCRQDAAVTKEYSMRVQLGQLSGAVAAWPPAKSRGWRTEKAGTLNEECSLKKSSVKSRASGIILAGSIPGRPVAPGWLANGAAALFEACRSAKCLSTSICWIRVIRLQWYFCLLERCSSGAKPEG